MDKIVATNSDIVGADKERMGSQSSPIRFCRGEASRARICRGERLRSPNRRGEASRARICRGGYYPPPSYKYRIDFSFETGNRLWHYACKYNYPRWLQSRCRWCLDSAVVAKVSIVKLNCLIDKKISIDTINIA